MKQNMKIIWNRTRFIISLLLMCLLQAGCGETEEEQQGKTCEVYYLNREETRISMETVVLDEELDQKGQIDALLSAMQTSPQDVSLKAMTGMDFQVNGYRVEEGQLDVDVDEGYRKLSPTTEVLVRAALVRTLTQADGINHVLMTVDGQTLTDNTGAAVGPMTADAFIDNAGEEINAYEMVTLQLYFANEEGNRLVGTSRTVVYNSNISLEKLVVENLVKGPDIEEVFPVINPSTKVLSVTVKDGTCYVNFDDGFLTQIYNVTADVVIYSITNSLVELPNVNRVQIAVNGKSDIIFRENFNLANVYERNLDLTRMEEDTY